MTIDVLKTRPNELKRNSVTPTSMTARPSVRRSLFGEVDHEESLKFLKKELDAISNSQKVKWNFDFVEERPIDSGAANFEWQRVRENEVVPKAYALSRLPYLFKNSEIVEQQKEPATYSTTTVEAAAHDDRLSIRLCDNEKVTCKRKLTQTTIPEFLNSKKRSTNSLPKCKKNETICQVSDDNCPEPEECDELSYHLKSNKKVRLSSPQN